jgi:3-oxoadipate enol-lactonase/4-carboxymuconolactone decarboxylase
MPLTRRGEINIHWRSDGPGEAPPLVLLHSIGTDMRLWDAVLPCLLPHFNIVRIDARGHGGSDVPNGDYRMEELATDVAAVMDAAGIAHAAVAGVSLGGMIAMQMALDHPARVSALVPICTSAAMDKAAWQARIERVRIGGTAAIADLAMSRFLSPEFAAAEPAIAAAIRAGLIGMPAAGYAGAATAIRDMALTHRLREISVPTLLIAGELDISTPFEGHGNQILALIPGAAVTRLAAGHLAPVETPKALAEALRTFLHCHRSS